MSVKEQDSAEKDVTEFERRISGESGSRSS